MNDQVVLLIVRLMHILGGIFWVGSAVILAGFILPALRDAGPEGGRFMQALMGRRRLPAYLGTAAGLTLLSGLALYLRDSGGLQWAWITSSPGLAFTIGALAALLAAVLGLLVAGRAGARAAALGRQIQRPAARAPRPRRRSWAACRRSSGCWRG